MPTDLDPIATLRRTDPATGWPVPEPPALDELVGRPAPPAPPGDDDRRRLLVLAAAALLAVALVGAAVAIATAPSGDEDPPPATSPPTTERPETATLPPVHLSPDEPLPAPLDLAPGRPAQDRLVAIADAAAADTGTPATGAVAYGREVERASTTIASETAADMFFTTVVRERWTTADGTQARRDSPGPPTREGQVVQTDPALAPPSSGTVATTRPNEGEVFVAGHEEPLPPSPPDPLARPQGADAVRADLLVGQGGERPGPAALERLTEILARQPVGGADRAALYRALATVEGIEDHGEVLDRAGRSGVALSSTSDVTGIAVRMLVVVDPATGTLLHQERVQLEGTPDLPAPLVTSYRIVLRTAWVGAVGEQAA